MIDPNEVRNEPKQDWRDHLRCGEFTLNRACKMGIRTRGSCVQEMLSVLCLTYKASVSRTLAEPPCYTSDILRDCPLDYNRIVLPK